MIEENWKQYYCPDRQKQHQLKKKNSYGIHDKISNSYCFYNMQLVCHFTLLTFPIGYDNIPGSE